MAQVDALLVGDGNGGSSPAPSAGNYRLGFQPAFRLYIDDRLVLNQRVGRSRGLRVAVSAIEVFQGVDSIHTLTITFVGEDAAVFVREHLRKRTAVRVEVGYQDVADSWQEVFAGHALQAYPSSSLPVRVEVECDSLIYQAREAQGSADNTDANQALYIKNRLATISEDYPLSVNIEGVADPEADEGGTDTGSLLEFLNKWAEDNYVHWVDLMNGEIHLYYPGAKPDFGGRPYRTWELSVRRVRPGDGAPPVLSTWSPRVSFVESPALIEAVWYDRTNPDRIQTVVVSAENPQGVPESKLQLGFLDVKSKDAAQAIVDAAADNYYWASMSGNFAVSAGLPITLFDEIVARNAPPGLEDYYDTPLEVYEVTHVLNDQGWTVSGKVWGSRGASRASTAPVSAPAPLEEEEGDAPG